MWCYPFGRPVTPRAPSASTPKPLFVLGAYPSAVHVEWHAPAPYSRVQAIAVDDEPSPFWDGADQVVVVEQWKAAIGFEKGWGAASANARFNGPCGQKLANNLFGPLHVPVTDAWITDCLDTYRGSEGGSRRIMDTYNPWACSAGLPAASIAPHPSEGAIVREALAEHRRRLLDELATARPELIVTLGNAALRIMRELVEPTDAPRTLAIESYGRECRARVRGQLVRWLPLAHPATPARYVAAHSEWAKKVAAERTSTLV
jgi:hypothetical protein